MLTALLVLTYVVPHHSKVEAANHMTLASESAKARCRSRRISTCTRLPASRSRQSTALFKEGCCKKGWRQVILELLSPFEAWYIPQQLRDSLGIKSGLGVAISEFRVGELFLSLRRFEIVHATKQSRCGKLGTQDLYAPGTGGNLYTYTYMYMHMYMYIYICKCKCICICICIYICIYIYIYLCMYMRMHMYMHMHI